MDAERLTESATPVASAPPASAAGLELALSSRLVAFALAALFAVAGLLLLFSRAAIFDEGLMTYMFAHWLLLHPVPVLFFQKAKPILSLVYALPAMGGADTVLAAHVLLAALAAPMLAAVARALGYRLPNVAALVVLASPLFLFGAATGISNVDGVVATSLFLYLAIAARRDWLAGVVLGCLPWLRYELAPFALLLWLYVAFVEGRRSIALGAFVFPLLYLAGGAVYHRDLLWLLHFPPAMAQPMHDNPVMSGHTTGLRTLLISLLLVTPVTFLAFTAPPGRLTQVERALALFAVVSIALIMGLPFVGLFNFDFSARYAMQTLPVLALLAARAAEAWLEPQPPRRAVLVAALALGAAWGLSAPAVPAVPGAAAVVTGLVCLYGAVAVLALIGWQRGAVGALIVTALAGLSLPPHEMTTPQHYWPAMAWMEAHASELSGATIYTNSHVLPFGIARSAALRQVDVRFIMPQDVQWEVLGLSNPDNGQRAAMQALAGRELFGPSVAWDAITPDTVPQHSFFVLCDDPRLAASMPESAWAGRLETIATGDKFSVARVVRAAAPAAAAEPHDGGASWRATAIFLASPWQSGDTRA